MLWKSAVWQQKQKQKQQLNSQAVVGNIARY